MTNPVPFLTYESNFSGGFEIEVLGIRFGVRGSQVHTAYKVRKTGRWVDMTWSDMICEKANPRVRRTLRDGM